MTATLIALLLARPDVVEEQVLASTVGFLALHGGLEPGTAEIARELPTLPIEFHAADHGLAELAADYKARFKISLADAFAAALAKDRKAELVTGDPEFEALEKEIKITWLK